MVRLAPLAFLSLSLSGAGQFPSSELEHQHLYAQTFSPGGETPTFEFEAWSRKVILNQSLPGVGPLVLGLRELGGYEFCFHCLWPWTSWADSARAPGLQLSLKAVGQRRPKRVHLSAGGEGKPPKLEHIARNKPYFANRAWTGTLVEEQCWLFPRGGASAWRCPVYSLPAG